LQFRALVSPWFGMKWRSFVGFRLYAAVVLFRMFGILFFQFLSELNELAVVDLWPEWPLP
jgi:hypothetical protein